MRVPIRVFVATWWNTEREEEEKKKGFQKGELLEQERHHLLRLFSSFVEIFVFGYMGFGRGHSAFGLESLKLSHL